MRAQIFLVWLAVFGIACGDDASNERDAATASDAGEDDDSGTGTGHDAGATVDPMASAMIGAEGGTISSTDEKVTLTIPKGALKNKQLITIEKLAKGESSALLADAIELVSYRFGPDGLVFEEPLQLDVELPKLIVPTADAAKAVVPLVFGSTVSKNTLEIVGKHALTVNLDSGNAVLRTELKHFSDFSADQWQPLNKLSTSYFYFEASPLPPSKMELSKKYGVGLSFYTRRFLTEALPLHYRDMSRGVVYSGGKKIVDIGSIPGEAGKPSSFVIDAGDYGCSKLGPATFEAKLTTDTFIFTPAPNYECESATEKAHCVGDIKLGPTSYTVSLKRKVQCIADKAVDPETAGAPFSGFVAYTRSDRGTMDLKGAFYDGGADQAKFDAYVKTQRRRLGIMPDRGANGTCRAVDIDLYDPNILDSGAAIDFSHVGSGADDAIRIDFMDSPNDPPYTASYQDIFGIYQSDFIFNGGFTELGLGVYIPTSSNTPTIVLPAWDAYTQYGKPTFLPGYLLAPLQGTDVGLTWKADEIGGDFIHVWGAGGDPESEDISAFECFISVEDQVLTIPAETIRGLYSAAPIDPLWLNVYVNWGSHTTTTYKGKTLDGYNIREYYSAEKTDDPNNPDD